MRVGGEFSESFAVEAGVRQGCVMSPWLFNIFMDGCIVKPHHLHTYGRSEGAQMANLITNREKCIWAVSAQKPPLPEEKK